ncbi:MAG: hypoxanthine-guanine phosphoribosyltransferase [Chlamydiota bacterium]|jgi:hypoxanthine phosphoribosyltransferase
MKDASLNHERCLIAPEAISARIKEIAVELNHDYRDKDLVVLMVLKGAICLAADLIRQLSVPFQLESVQCSSYGARGDQRGALEIIGLDRVDIRHRDVLVVDDIFDSGHTLSVLVQTLETKEPRSIKSLVLLKKNVVRTVTMEPDYVLFEIDNLFVIGYGLDYKEGYRGLAGVHVLK